MIRAVVFDLDDTLIVEEASALAAMATALRAVGAPSGADAVDTVLTCARAQWRTSVHHATCGRLGIASWEGLWATFEGCHPCLDGLAEWVVGYRRSAWSDALQVLGAEPALAVAASAAYVDTQRRGHPPIPSAIDAVRAAAGVRTGLLTNGPPDIQRLKVAQCGLDGAFDAVVISGEVGVGKPDPEVFAMLLGRLGVPAAQAVMVGDSWTRDVNGAIGAGMSAIWVSHGRPPPEAISGVTVVDQVTPALLAGL